MTDETTDNPAGRTKAKRDRWVKIGFLVVGAVACVLIFRRQTSVVGMNWPKGPAELSKALSQSGDQKRPVLVFFYRTKPSDATRRLIKGTLARPQNRKAIEDGGFLRVQIPITDPQSSTIARRYRLRKYPTMLVLGANGWEHNRREGFIGEAGFRDGFLDCGEVRHAGVVGWRNAKSQADMDGVLSDAKGQGRSVLILFAPTEADKATKELYEATLAHQANRKAIEDADLILVHVPVADVKNSVLGKRYHIDRLPTMLLLTPDGSPRKRRTGAIPKKLFLLDFLGSLSRPGGP